MSENNNESKSHRPHVNENKVQTAGGWIVQNVSRSSGGVRHKTISEDRQEDGDSVTFRKRLVRTVDHEIIVKDIDAIAGARVKQLLRRYCVLTPLGWWTDDAGLAALNAKIEPLHEKVRDLNNAAVQVGSLHRGRVGIVPLALSPDLEHAGTEIRRAIVERLSEARDKIVAGKYHKETVLGPVRNLARVVTGLTRTEVTLAVECLTECVNVAAKALKDAKDVAAAVAAVDLMPVEGVIASLQIEAFEESVGLAV